MRYQKLNHFSGSEFKRLVGVPRQVFNEMTEVLKKAESLKKKSGRPHTLALEDQLLLMLNYLRNYSTQLELAANWVYSRLLKYFQSTIEIEKKDLV